MSEEDRHRGHEKERESEADYLSRVEACYRRLRARPLLLSPADFRRVQQWHARGVPRWLVERTLEELFERAKEADRPAPRSLAYCASAVEEGFKAWQAVQVPPQRSGASSTGEEDLAGLVERAASQVAASRAPEPARENARVRLAALARGLAGGGEDLLMQIQRSLLDACWESLSASEQAAVGAEVEARIAPFRDRMQDSLLERAIERTRDQELLRRFELPDLSLLPLLGG